MAHLGAVVGVCTSGWARMAEPLALSPVDEYCFDVAGFVIVRGALSVRLCGCLGASLPLSF